VAELNLFSHTETHAGCYSTVTVHSKSLECHLSAYCAALRIQFYRWRMTRSNLMCCLRAYKSQVEAECFKCYFKQLSYFISEEYSCIQGPDRGQFHEVQTGLGDKPIEVNSVIKALMDTKTSHFCTVCEDIHVVSDYVLPQKCSYAFGRECLQPLLNCGTPSSHTLPTYWTRLRGPLKWQPVKIINQRDMIVGLLRALQPTIAYLQ
jgi:hypothetical protein